MAKVCEICGKSKHVGHTRKLLRGHRNVTGKRDFKPNLQKTLYECRRVLVCTKCIHSLSQNKIK